MSERVMYGNLTLAVAPTAPVITVPDAKDQSRVLHSAEDDLLDGYIDAATAYLDGRDGVLGRALMPQTWDYALPCFPIERYLPLPLAPVQSITSIQYRDSAGTLQTFGAANYQLSADKNWWPRAHLAYGASWPGTRDEPDAVIVKAVYGYTLVPAALKQAVVLLVAHMYQNREPVNIGNITTELPFGVNALIEPYMRMAF